MANKAQQVVQVVTGTLLLLFCFMLLAGVAIGVFGMGLAVLRWALQ